MFACFIGCPGRYFSSPNRTYLWMYRPHLVRSYVITDYNIICELNALLFSKFGDGMIIDAVPPCRGTVPFLVFCRR
jgi:hypothetical protein